MNKRTLVIGSGLLLILLFIGGVFGYRAYQAEHYGFLAQENAAIFVRPHSFVLGSDDAKVYMVEFSNPSCSACARFHPIVKKMLADYSGKIKLVFRYKTFRASADKYVKILEAARAQGKYLEALEIMYNTQRQWNDHKNPNPDLLWPLLSRAGIDVERARADMNNPAFTEILTQDLADARALKVRKTPSVFVNGKPLAKPDRAQLQALIESEIESSYGASK